MKYMFRAGAIATAALLTFSLAPTAYANTGGNIELTYDFGDMVPILNSDGSVDLHHTFAVDNTDWVRATRTNCDPATLL